MKTKRYRERRRDRRGSGGRKEKFPDMRCGDGHLTGEVAVPREGTDSLRGVEPAVGIEPTTC